MPRTPATRVELSPGFRLKLQAAANAAGVGAEELAASVLTQYLLTGTAETSTSSNKGGRPRTVEDDDLPRDVERDATPSGFRDVTQRGRFWVAKVKKTTIGRFSSPEIAAMARHYVIMGFRIGRGAYFGAAGHDVTAAMQMAVMAGFGPLGAEAPPATSDQDPAAPADPAQADSPGEVDEPGDVRGSPPKGPGRTSGGPRAAPVAVGGMAPASSTKTVAQMDLVSQLLSEPSSFTIDDEVTAVPPPAVKRSANTCPVCDGNMNPGVGRKHTRLCLLCSDDYEVWSKLPATGETGLGTPGVLSTNGAPATESFAAYVRHLRG